MADKIYQMNVTLSDGTVVNAGTFAAPQGPAGTGESVIFEGIYYPSGLGYDCGNNVSIYGWGVSGNVSIDPGLNGFSRYRLTWSADPRASATLTRNFTMPSAYIIGSGWMTIGLTKNKHTGNTVVTNGEIEFTIDQKMRYTESYDNNMGRKITVVRAISSLNNSRWELESDIPTTNTTTTPWNNSWRIIVSPCHGYSTSIGMYIKLSKI